MTTKVVDWIIANGLLAIGSITEIDGKIKAAGKTTFIKHLIRCVLDGHDFLGQPTRKARVLSVTEQSRAVIIARHDRKSGGDVGDSGRGSSQVSGDVHAAAHQRPPCSRASWAAWRSHAATRASARSGSSPSPIRRRSVPERWAR